MEHDKRPLGKDSSYQTTIEKMKRLLLEHGFEVEEVSWQNPVPNVWSVHLRDQNCPQLFTNGKGRSRDAALASALGEFHERLACDFFFSDYYYGKEVAQSSFVHHPTEKWFFVETPFSLEQILPKELALFYDETQELTGSECVDFNSGNSARGICTLPFVDVSTNEQVFFPVNILNNLYVSNGMAAGNTLHEARVQALSEIIERYVKNRVIAECISLPEIPSEVLNAYPSIAQGIDKLEQEGFRILVQDASLGGEFPVVNVTLINPIDNGVFAAFGTHPIFEVALERTLTELLQGRSLEQLTQFPSPSFHVEDVANPRNLEMHFVDSTGLLHYRFLKDIPDSPFCHWNFEGDTEQQYEYLLAIIKKMEKRTYVAEYTHFGVYCCRIIIPGISEIYPVEDLKWENKSLCLPVRDELLRTSSLTTSSREALYAFMEEMSFPREQPLFDLVGVLPSAESPWAFVCVGEFNAMLCLAIHNKDDALMWSEWCASSPLLSESKRKLYKCICTILTIEKDGEEDVFSYHSSLNKLFGKTLLERSVRMIGDTKVFDSFGDFQLNAVFAPHVKLLDAYQKCQRAKSKI